MRHTGKILFWLTAILMLHSANAFGQKDSLQIRDFFSEALNRGRSYENLRNLCKSVGHRISGSPQAQRAVDLMRGMMQEYGFDTVYLQEVMVPKWVRGEKEQASVTLSNGKTVNLKILALGNSVGTGLLGLKGNVVEVRSWKELEVAGKAGSINGKIVFFNRPMNPSFINAFHAYGDAVDQRSRGASEASRYGAVAVMVRSMSHAHDSFPHTGALHYNDSLRKIAAVAVSTNDADVLSVLLKKDPALKLSITTTCLMYDDVPSYNVIAEIRGSEFPQQIIAFGGHLDSWDVGEGAHDDGAGCIQSVEALRLFKVLKVRPRRTLRCVLFMNEENGLRGARKYAEEAERKNEFHLAAIESDRGAFTPRGFSIDGTEDVRKKVQSWSPLLAPYGLDKIEEGGGGSDIGPLKKKGVTLIGYVPDSQRYFDFHHTNADVFESINRRELEMSAASMAALIWLISEYGL